MGHLSYGRDKTTKRPVKYQQLAQFDLNVTELKWLKKVVPLNVDYNLLLNDVL